MGWTAGWLVGCVDGWFPTSVFSDRPLLKKISETATYAIVTSGFNGPERERDKHVFVKSLLHNFKIQDTCTALCDLIIPCFVCRVNFLHSFLKVL